MAMNTTHVMTLLTDPDRNVRQRAALALGGVRDAAVAEALVARLGVEDDLNVRENLTWAVVQQGPDVVPSVLALLDSRNPLERRQAAHVLSKIGDTAFAPALAGVIADADPEVAVKAFRAAANTGSPEVVPGLVARLGDESLDVRDALTRALERLGELGVPALVQALADGDASVRAHAAEALGHIGSPAADVAVEPLQAVLGDADAEVRLAAVMSLGALDVDDADLLASARESADPRVRSLAERFDDGR